MIEVHFPIHCSEIPNTLQWDLKYTVMRLALHNSTCQPSRTYVSIYGSDRVGRHIRMYAPSRTIVYSMPDSQGLSFGFRGESFKKMALNRALMAVFM